MELHTKYRPALFKHVIGQRGVVASLQGLLKKAEEAPHTYLFSGPSGTGKTTLARIVAKKVGCDKEGIVEVDAATNSGVDDMRNIMELAQYQSLGHGGKRFIIIDECHRLSKNAWDSMLKVLEEPPDHAYFALCTTELDKVPKTIQTRCHSYTLSSVQSKEIEQLLLHVCEKEKLFVDENALRLIARESMGSPRQALVFLTMASTLTSTKDLQALLWSKSDSAEAIELFRLLVSGKATWNKCRMIVEKLKDPAWESIRITLLNYTAAVLVKEKNEGRAAMLAFLISCFSTPFNRSCERAEFLKCMAEYILSD